MKYIVHIILFKAFLVPPFLSAQMIANITHDVQTDFGVYRPYPVVFSPVVPVFTVATDLSNVTNYEALRYAFTATDEELLRQNHFTVKYSLFKQMFDTYNECTIQGTPVFVTTDAVLHIYHVFFDQMLADIEVQEFVNTLDVLIQGLLDATETVYTQSHNPQSKEAVRRNMAFLGVASKLLNGDDAEVPELVAALVDSELVLIADHDGYHISPILGNFSALDYSVYQPRGHYTQNEILKAYFKTMMWFGLATFTMEPQKFGDLARRHTLQALILTQMIYSLDADDQSLYDSWGRIYEPTCFFVGKTDDPNVKNYKIIADVVYGSEFLSLSPDQLADPALLDQFMFEAQRLPEPKIPNWILGTFVTYKGFRFMGQRFIPDSYMFAHLVQPDVPDRLFPKGLDVMAILGSDRAYDLLDSIYGETSYVNYPDAIDAFRNEFAGLADADWARNLYWNWLYCLMPLLYTKGVGYPFFMQTTAWADKELLTALASWAELRHDTILYAKQSCTPSCLAPGPPKSYVEPNPYLYTRLASLVRYTQEGLESFGLLLSDYEERLSLFETLLLFLKKISIKELEDTPITTLEYEDIYRFGKVMEQLVSKKDDPLSLEEDDIDDMAVVADVHTDSYTRQCLEEGVGYPLEIFVIVNEGGIPRIARGAMFSYYEFLQPISHRLTDETWREMLLGDSPPDMPGWVDSFMDTEAPRTNVCSFSSTNIFGGDFAPEVDQAIRMPLLHQNMPNPFYPTTTIRFVLPHQTRVTLHVFNLLGQKVKTLVDDVRSAGTYSVRWQGKDDMGMNVSSGIYLVRLVTEDGLRVRKMYLVR